MSRPADLCSFATPYLYMAKANAEKNLTTLVIPTQFRTLCVVASALDLEGYFSRPL